MSRIVKAFMSIELNFSKSLFNITWALISEGDEAKKSSFVGRASHPKASG
jgi:hypothetical protein